jgi:predicted membrane channel-forming protein YqfA (hemolysin III family)
MNELQKELIKKIAIFFLVVFGIISLFYICTTYQIVGAIILIGFVGGFILFIIGWVFYIMISAIISDYKIRGILNKEEYELYSMCLDSRNVIWLSGDDDKEYQRILEIIKDHNIKL